MSLINQVLLSEVKMEASSHGFENSLLNDPITSEEIEGALEENEE